MGIVNKRNVMDLDFKDWIMISDDCEDNIEKWLKFKSGDYPDPDCVLKMDNTNMECVAVNLKWYSDKEKKEQCYIDCIFSFATFFKPFLRYYVGEHMPYLGQVYENYRTLFSNKNKNEFCKRQGIKRESLDKLFVQLDRFARNTHTLGNYMPCPDNKYNAIKGNYFKYKDRLEKLYVDISNPLKNEFRWNDWFRDNCEKDKLFITNILDNQKLLAFEFNGNKMGKKHINSYAEYIETVNAIIEERGKILAGEIN